MNILKKYKSQLIAVLPVIGIIGVVYFFQCLKVPMAVMNVFLTVTSFVYMNYWWKKNAASNWEMWFIWAAFAARIVICLLDIYAPEYIELPFTGGDSKAYLYEATAYYHGELTYFSTYYTYVVNAIFQIAGINRFAAQFVNILCWCICTVIMQKLCDLMKIDQKIRFFTIAVYSFMPVNMIYTSILMREAIPATAMLYLFYCILRWMKDGKHLPLAAGVIISAPGFLLHNSMLGIWAILAFVLIFYSNSKQKFQTEKKAIYGIALFLGLIVLIGIAQANNWIYMQLPDFKAGIFTAINVRLESFYSNHGGSTYLINEYVYDYPSLIIGTIKRMGYFLCSPVPFLWRGLGDIIAFLGSTIVYVLCVFAAVISIFLKKKDPYRFVMGSTAFIICGIFAWMVSNGGTAMRHREKFLGMFLLMGAYSLKIIATEWKAKKEKVENK